MSWSEPRPFIQASVAKLVKALVFIYFGPAVQKVVDSTTTIDQVVFIEIYFLACNVVSILWDVK